MRTATSLDGSGERPDKTAPGTCRRASRASVRLLLVTFLALLVATVGAGGTAHAAGTTYYLDLAGDDANSGTSASSPWRTISRVNALDLSPGDRVLIKGGQTFPGNLRLGTGDAGTATSPVVIGSFGGGRATISAGTGKGISIYNAGGIEVRDLVVQGTGYAAGNRGSGVEVYTDLGDATKLEHIRVEGVEAKGFGESGILLGAYPEDGTKSGFRDVRITDVSAHDNADAGIQSFGHFSESASGWAHEDVYVGRCRAYNNPGIPGKGNNSGSGVVLGDVNGATIERCVAHGNGSSNDHEGGGPIGIWAWDSNAVTIQHNESYGNKTGTIDGGGFDLDGGVTNSVMQYNYSHDNAGAGYLLYQFRYARPFENNVVRYNISENDGRTNLGGIYAGGGVTDTEIYNNTVLVSPRAAGGGTFAARAEGTSGFHFRNNLFVTTGGVPLVEIPYEQEGLLFQGNGYWSSGDPFVIAHGGASYSSLGSWRDATAQESHYSQNTGLSADPRLREPGDRGTAGEKLRADSPMKDVALNLPDAFGLDPGPTDFYGTSVAQGAGYDIGAHEVPYVAPPPNSAPTISGLRPIPGSSTRDRTPTVRATVRDAETDLAKRNIKLYVDGRRKVVYSYDRDTDRLTYTSRFSPGRHTVKVVATDAAGTAKSRAWSFRIVR